jgi:hypothetical protein
VADDFGAGWHRLHPLSPFINAGRLLSSLLGIAVLSLVTADGLRAYVIQVAGAAALVVAGFVGGSSPGGSWTAPRCASRPACCAGIRGSSR